MNELPKMYVELQLQCSLVVMKINFSVCMRRQTCHSLHIPLNVDYQDHQCLLSQCPLQAQMYEHIRMLAPLFQA